jgi:hypothetical protein
MLAAKAFFRAGFKIEVRPETGQLGSDFDFAATCQNVTVNVEVTALEEKEFYEKTALNALRKKRKQLPKDHPAVIFCVIPAQWEKIGKNINDWSAVVARRFLSGTRRVNVLVFQLERHIDTAADRSRGGFILVSKPFANPNPYFPCDLDFVFSSRGPAEQMQTAIARTAENSEAAEALANQIRTGEFYEWVDYLSAKAP